MVVLADTGAQLQCENVPGDQTDSIAGEPHSRRRQNRHFDAAARAISSAITNGAAA